MKHSVLFVCLGNICRSPAAEGIMKHIVGNDESFFIDSAGIGDWHTGQLPDRRMRRHGEKHGYTFNSHARQITKSDFERFDIIVAMDDDNYRTLTRMASTDEQRRKVVRMATYLRHHPNQHDVPDPYYGGEQDFEWVIELLEDACRGLYSAITSSNSGD